jgi:predicted TIM-barrel fold metal-dependent hydrolase
MKRSSKFIDFEAHGQAREYVKELLHYEGYPRYTTDEKGRLVWHQSPTRFELRHGLQPKLDDPSVRFRDMDENGIDVQVVSPSAPNCEIFPKDMGIRLSKINNDYITKLAAGNPSRIIPFGSIPLQDVNASLEELDRMRSIGMKGLLTPPNVHGEHLDQENFRPIFERLERYRLPIFIHPAPPPHPEMYSPYHLWGPAFGFGADAALCALRIIMGGVLEDFPNVKIILGHLGETIPFIIKRINFVYNRSPDALPKIKKAPSAYFLKNFYVDTAGIFHQPSLNCAIETLDQDKILFASDYPFEKASEGVKYIEEASISDECRENISWKNAERLFAAS